MGGGVRDVRGGREDGVTVADGPLLRPPVPRGAIAALHRFRSEFLDHVASVGRYRLRRVLGMGGMGVVFEAEDTQLRRDVAVKLFRTADATTDRSLRKLRGEAQALARLSDPHIVHVFDFGTLDTDDDTGLPAECSHSDAYMVMELVDGVPLSEARAYARTWSDALALFDPVITAIARAHAAGVVHGDIKPNNIMVARGGEPKILDFGLARIGQGESHTSSEPHQTAVTETSAPTKVAGTPAYMSPETFSGATATPLSDQYALCCTILEVALAQRVFPQKNVQALLAAKQAETFVLGRDGRAMPRRAMRALLRGMARDPTRRHASLEALRKALHPPARWGRRMALVGAVAVSALFVSADSSPARPLEVANVSVGANAERMVSNTIALRTGRDECRGDILRLETAFHETTTLGLTRPAARLGVQLATMMIHCLDDRSQARHWLREAETQLSRGPPSPTLEFLVERTTLELDGATAQEHVPLYEAFLRTQDEAAGRRDTWAETLWMLSPLYFNVGRTEEGLRVAEIATEAMRADHGPNDARTARALSTLALAHYRRGEAKRAAALLRVVVQTMEATLGRDHQDTLRNRVNLGAVLLSADGVEEALGILEAVDEPLRRRYGPNHRVVVGNAVNAALGATTYGAMRGDMAWLRRGEALIRAALVDDEAAESRRDRRLGSRLHALGINLIAQGRLDDAAEVMEEAVRMLGVSPDDSEELKQATYHQARGLILNRRAREGVPLLESLQAPGTATAELRTAIDEVLVSGYAELGRPAEAAAALARIREDALAPAERAQLRGVIAEAAGDCRNAVEHFRAAANHRRDAEQPTLLDASIAAGEARCLERLGATRRARARADEATTLCRRVQAPAAQTCDPR